MLPNKDKSARQTRNMLRVSFVKSLVYLDTSYSELSPDMSEKEENNYLIDHYRTSMRRDAIV